MERISRQQVSEVVGGRCAEEGRKRRAGGVDKCMRVDSDFAVHRVI